MMDTQTDDLIMLIASFTLILSLLSSFTLTQAYTLMSLPYVIALHKA